tara:strand:+ start:24 stop:569 length:546 start_codon:yes stop_codon:yes gene_type:complete
MKYILTLEKYFAYSDFQRKWGSPVEMREDVDFCLGRLLPKEDMIKSVEDQSTADGVKFYIELKTGGYLHMYKVSGFRMQPSQGWEYYFNKKKKDYEVLKKELEEKHLKQLGIFLKYFKSYDFYAAYIDDGRQYKAAQQNNERLEDQFNSLSASDKKYAKKEILKHFKSKELQPKVEQTFKI